jgi:ABC-type spermidine/putrescine transport system permease subunit II
MVARMLHLSPTVPMKLSLLHILTFSMMQSNIWKIVLPHVCTTQPFVSFSILNKFLLGFGLSVEFGSLEAMLTNSEV